MNCSRLALLTSTAVIASLLPPSPRSQEAKAKVVVKFATLAPEGSTWMKTMRAIDQEVRRATDARIRFRFYPGGVQGDERDVLRKIRNGQLHGGGFTGYGLGTIAPAVRVLELPFLFRNLDEVDFVRSKMDSFFVSTFAAKGYLHLGWADVGLVYIFSNSPITSPEELRRVKMWIWSGDPLARLFFKSFQVSPIPLAAPDVLTSLQMGVVDAVYASPLACIALQWYTRLRYMTRVPVSHALGAVLVSRKALASARPADVEILLTTARRRLKALNRKTRRQNQEALDILVREGIKIIDVSDEMRTEFFRRGSETWQDGVGKFYSRELLEQVNSILERYRLDRSSGSRSRGGGEYR